MSDDSHPIDAASANGPQSAGKLLPLVYDELRQLAAAYVAREDPHRTCNATALVHEAYLRLSGKRTFDDRRQFFGAAAEAMRRILVDQARRRRAARRGGGALRIVLDPSEHAAAPDSDVVIEIDEAITALAIEDATSAELARLRLFAGLSIDEAATLLGMSRATAFREWAYARAWLASALKESGSSGDS